MSGTPRLGRGLDALFNEGARGSGVGTQSGLMLEVSAIQPDPNQPRKNFRPEAMDELVESIRVHGVLQPILVSKKDGSEGYTIVAGERRWRAAQSIGLQQIPAVVRDTDSTSRMLLALVENLQRSDLGILEEAAAYDQLQNEFGLTQQEIGRRVGRSRSAVANTLRLLDLPSAVMELVRSGDISAGHARALLQLQNYDRQIEIATLITDDGLSVRDVERLIAKESNSKPKRRTQLPADSESSRLEEAIQQKLGTRVTLKRNSNGQGQMIIHFYSDDELTGIIENIIPGGDF
tara:strand:+ start:442 stop:1314 length:873 start_codon:yes stop_codon:yes gene_type:complete